MSAAQARRLAMKLGCFLAVDTRHKTVEIHLPAGTQVVGNPGLNVLVSNTETMEGTWASVLSDLKDMEDGIEEIPAAA